MSTLILSCNTGEGHNSASKGIKEYYAKFNEKCDVVDALSFVSKKFSKNIVRAHSVLYKYFPKLNDFLYKLAEKNEDKLDDNFIGFKMLSRGANNLYNYIVKGGYDTVISVHVFSAYMLNLTLNKYGIKVKTAFVSTDYSYMPTINKTAFNYYFIPDEDIRAEFINKKIDGNKIVVSGIPVSSRFYGEKSNSIEGDFGENYGDTVNGNAENYKIKILIASGSFGCGPIKKIVSNFIKSGAFNNASVKVVCGRNKRLYKNLNDRRFNKGVVEVLGFTTNMPYLLENADLLITKPGGLTITEAIIKKTPMLIFNAVSGCERDNVKFLNNKGIAKSVNSVSRLNSELTNILKDKKYLENLKKILLSLKVKNSAKIIYDTLHIDKNAV